MKAYAATDVGGVRPINEDSYYLPAAGECFCAVADGMGGHQAGEVASAMAVRVFSDQLRGVDAPDEECIRSAVEKANEEIFTAAQNAFSMRGMGTTLTAVCFGADDVVMAHVGDSRAYLYRSGALMQLSEDHSFVEELVKSGRITEEEAQTHPQRNVITRALGTHMFIKVDVLRMQREAADVWLLCSDGLTRYVNRAEISEVLSGTDGWQEKAHRLVQMALERGGQDNITVLIATGEEDGHEQ